MVDTQPEPKQVQKRKSIREKIDEAVGCGQICRKRDRCGNPVMYLRKNRMSKSAFRQFTKYSLHCVQWLVLDKVRLYLGIKYFKICERIRAKNRTTERMLAKARQDLVEEKKKSWKADCASRDLARKDQVI